MNQTAFDRALGFLQAGEMESAAETCRKELSEQPEDGRLRTLYGMVLVRQNRFAEAETELREVLSRWPDVAKANRELANALIAQGRNEEAIAAYRRVVELRPEDPVAYRDLSMALKTLGRMEEAFETLNSSFKLDPESRRLELAADHQRAGEFDKAESTTAAGELIAHDTRRNDFPKLGKHFVELRVVSRPRQVAHKQLVLHWKNFLFIKSTFSWCIKNAFPRLNIKDISTCG